ncbi:hypothetical protein V8E36_000618 [Tilletia maclaganii]
MATSMQFGPEWMRKAANRSSSSLSNKEPASPNPNAFRDAAGSPFGPSAAATTHSSPSNGTATAGSGGTPPSAWHQHNGSGGPYSAAVASGVGGGSIANRRKTSLGNASPLSFGSGAGGAGTTGGGTGSPAAVASPGTFSFAAAAAGLSSADREQRDRDRSSGTVTMGGSGRFRLIKRDLTDNGPPSPNPGGSPTHSPTPFAPPTPSSPSLSSKPAHNGSTSSISSISAVASGQGAGTAPAVVSPGLGRGPGGSWPGSRLHRQRSLADGGGPIGPPADGSAGFHKFAGYDRKRERQQTTTGPANGVLPGTGSRSASGVGGASGQDTSIDDPDSRRSSDGAGAGHKGGDSLNGNGHDSLADSVSALGLGGGSSGEHSVDAPAWSPETAFWQYRDPSGQVQGPFSAINMQDWYKQNYFSSDLLVKRQEEDNFRPLGDVLLELGNTDTPFLLPPPPRQQEPPRGPPGLASAHQPGASFDSSAVDSPVSHTSHLNNGARPDDTSISDGHPSLAHTPSHVFRSVSSGMEASSIGANALGPVDYRDNSWSHHRTDSNSVASSDRNHAHLGGPNAVLGGGGAGGGGNDGPGLGQRRPWPNLDLDIGGFGAAGGTGPASPFGANGVPRSPFAATANLLGMGPHSARQPAGVPASPFGVPSVANLDLDARLRQQEELLAIARQRELQEQRQAAVAAAARAGYPVGMAAGIGAEAFGGLHAPGRRGWDEMPSSAGAGPPGPAPWQQFGGISGPNVPTPGGPQAFYESFNQGPRPIGPGPGVPWASSPMTPARMPFEQHLPPHGGQEDAFSMAGQNQIPPPSPWSTHGHGQVPAPAIGMDGQGAPYAAQQEQQHIPDAATPVPTSAPTVGAVGTPRRVSSPAPPPAEPEVQTQPQAEQAAPVEEPTFTPAAPEPETVNVAPEAEPEPEPQVEQVEAPSEDPEELWPADPSAVEFAPEPSFDDAATGKGKFEEAASAQAARRTRRGGRQLRGDSNDDDGDVPAGYTSGNLRLVGQDQFKRNASGSGPHSSVEAPLSARLPEAGGTAQTPPVTAKPAPWASKAEEESSANTGGPSLREIQAAEARNAEAKRNAQRAAAERLAKANPLSTVAAAANDNTPLPATMSWGLASVPPSGLKEPPIAPSIQPGGNAWQHKAGGSAGSGALPPPPKKTLMEIQEEEERKRAAQRQAEHRSAQQAAALRKGYADSASRSISNPQPQPSIAAIAGAQGGGVAGSAGGAAAAAGGAWSVVGASGKTSAGNPPVAGAGAPPGVTRAVSGTAQRVASGPVGGNGAWPASGAAATAAAGGGAASATTKPPGGVGGGPTSGLAKSSVPASAAAAASSAARKPSGRPASSAGGADAGPPAPPSSEFLQYCKDHLKGLSIRVDDFIEMLLSFPLDPSPDVIEIIAESVYANSSTLDGRRFAADFVAKRKLDAQGRFANGTVSTGHGFGAGSGGGGGGNGLSSAGGSGGGGGGGGAGAGSGGAWTPAGGAGGRTASEVLKSQPSASRNESPFGFKVVKGKGNKKRN